MGKRIFQLGFLPAVLLGLFLGSLPAQPPPAPMVIHGRGRVTPKNIGHLKALKAFQALPPLCDLPAYDARADNLVPPIKNQSSCGSCWDFSGTGMVEIAYRKAGLGPVELSEQYTLSCCRNGGCNGDDNTTVLQWARQHGLPLTKDYGSYAAREGQCKYTQTMKLHKVDDWGFADGGTQPGYDRVTDTQSIKNAIHAYGSVGCAVAATRTWDNYRPGTVHRGNSKQIDHDVILVGWKDDKSLPEGGYWIMRNSWGEDWGDKGYMMIAYGADSVGTEAVYCFVDNPNPPPKPPDPPAPKPEPDLPGGRIQSWAIVACAIFDVGVVVVALFYIVKRRK